MMPDPTIVLLAAGRSARMRGTDKLMEPVDGEPLLVRMAARAAKAGAVRVVLAPSQTDRRAALAPLGVEIADAPERAGMAASIVAGLSGLSGPVLIMLADMPEISANDLHLMISLSRNAPGAILRAASADGTPGHPVLFPADVLPELERLTGDRGARPVLESHEARVVLVPLGGRRALVDLDTPEDWEAWKSGRQGGTRKRD